MFFVCAIVRIPSFGERCNVISYKRLTDINEMIFVKNTTVKSLGPYQRQLR